MLKDYIEATARRIISEKLQQHKEPASCTFYELLNCLHDDVTECLQLLHAEGEYICTTTVNKIPMLLPVRR